MWLGHKTTENVKKKGAPVYCPMKPVCVKLVELNFPGDVCHVLRLAARAMRLLNNKGFFLSGRRTQFIDCGMHET